MKTPLLFIAGWGRSGSTILSNVLNEIPGYLNVGELNYAWEKLFLDGSPCGCGHGVHDCPLWSEVFARLYGSVDATPVDDLIRLRAHVPSPKDLLLTTDRSPSPEVLEYANAFGALYAAVADVSGAQVIVESSKTPSHLYLLGLASTIDLHVLHLVRDPRATAFSWMREKKRLNTKTGEETYMHRLSPLVNCRRYWSSNLAVEKLIRRRAHPSVRLRYEDFCRAPATEIGKAVQELGLPFEHQPFTSENEIELGLNHTVWGNPGRIRNGPTTVREDASWTEQLSLRHRLLVTALTLPLLRRYQYPLLTPGPDRRP